MPDITKLIDLAALGEFKNKMVDYIDTADALSLKYLSYDANTRVVSFYKTADGTGTADFTVTLPDTSNFIEKIVNGAADNFVLQNADGTLKDGGSSIGANRISITDSGSYFTSDDVEGALAELAQASAGGVASKTVYITQTPGSSSDPFSKRYSIYQGATGSSASPVAGEKLVDIDLAKDMVVTSGSVGTVTTADVPYEGAVPGDKYIDLVIANATSDHIYIPANSLVDIYTAQQSAAQVQLVIDNNNEISATIVAGSIGSTELASDAVVTAKIADANVTKTKLAQTVQDSLDLADTAVQPAGLTSAIEALDADLDASGTAQHSGTFVVSGVTEVDGVLTAVDSVEVEAAGAAAAAVAALDSNTNTLTAVTDSSLAVITEVGITDGLLASVKKNTLGSAATHADTDFMASADYTLTTTAEIDALFD